MCACVDHGNNDNMSLFAQLLYPHTTSDLIDCMGCTSTQLQFSLIVWGAEAFSFAFCCGSHHQSHNKTIQAKCFCKDEDQNHADIKAWLLRICTDARVTYYANGKTCSQRTHANCESGTKVCVARIG